jgi:hypothetical protein
MTVDLEVKERTSRCAIRIRKNAEELLPVCAAFESRNASKSSQKR